MSSIFFSYSHKDRDIVDRIAADLQKFGFYIWVDKAEIKIGDSLIKKIREGIDKVEYVGAVISKNSINSEWVQREIDIAMNQEIEGKKVKVLPILIDTIDLPWFLKGKLYADFTDEPNYKNGIMLLVDRLTSNNEIRMRNVNTFEQILKNEEKIECLKLKDKLKRYIGANICDWTIEEERLFLEKARGYGFLDNIEPTDQEKCFGDRTAYQIYRITQLGREFLHWIRFNLE